MPNPDHLRKQARLFLRWHRDRHHPVAAELRAHLPRFSGLSDAEVLDQPFRLADALELLARRHGFGSWPALIEGERQMPSPPRPAATASQLLRAEPCLFVTDMERAVAFYTAKLGFTVAFLHGEPAFYGQVMRDGARLNLRHADMPALTAEFRAVTEDALAASVVLEEAKPLFLEYEAAGVAFHQRLRDEPWGARTFIVADPDGNLILFAGG